MTERHSVIHPFEPVFDKESGILILGSFPSVKSRENGFYYGHPQNRFWRVTAAVFADAVPQTVEEKRRFLLRHHVALWDCIQSCEIMGSGDSTIQKAVPNDLSALLEKTKIQHIFTNGKTADKIYRQYLYRETGLAALCLPSTSPANAAFSLEKLIEFWKVIDCGK